MNIEEKRLLTDFLDQLKSIQSINKDAEAASLIQAAGAVQPDALYLLTQKALLQEQALNGAKAQIAALQRELSETRKEGNGAGGFLGNNPWAAPAARSTPAVSAQPYAQPPAVGTVAAPSAFGSFLGTAATTAAGVAAGAFLFQGIESLMGHHGGYGGFSDTGYMGHNAPENVTINEYYGDGAQPPHSADTAYRDDADAGFSDVSGDDSWDAYDDNNDSIDI